MARPGHCCLLHTPGLRVLQPHRLALGSGAGTNPAVGPVPLHEVTAVIPTSDGLHCPTSPTTASRPFPPPAQTQAISLWASCHLPSSVSFRFPLPCHRLLAQHTTWPGSSRRAPRNVPVARGAVLRLPRHEASQSSLLPGASHRHGRQSPRSSQQPPTSSPRPTPWTSESSLLPGASHCQPQAHVMDVRVLAPPGSLPPAAPGPRHGRDGGGRSKLLLALRQNLQQRGQQMTLKRKGCHHANVSIQGEMS